MHGIYLLRDFCVKGTELFITFGLWKVRVTKESKSKEGGAGKKKKKKKKNSNKYLTNFATLMRL